MLSLYCGRELDRIAEHHYGLKRRAKLGGLLRESDNALRRRCLDAMRAYTHVTRHDYRQARAVPWGAIVLCAALATAGFFVFAAIVAWAMGGVP